MLSAHGKVLKPRLALATVLILGKLVFRKRFNDKATDTSRHIARNMSIFVQICFEGNRKRHMYECILDGSRRTFLAELDMLLSCDWFPDRLQELLSTNLIFVARPPLNCEELEEGLIRILKAGVDCCAEYRRQLTSSLLPLPLTLLPLGPLRSAREEAWGAWKRALVRCGFDPVAVWADTIGIPVEQLRDELERKPQRLSRCRSFLVLSWSICCDVFWCVVLGLYFLLAVLFWALLWDFLFLMLWALEGSHQSKILFRSRVRNMCESFS
jgi:hypothetical protein